METEKDFIKREIEKLNLVLISLINKIIGAKSINIESEIQDTNQTLKDQIGFTLLEISEMNNSDLILHLRKLHSTNLEKLMQLMYEIIQKLALDNSYEIYNKRKIAQKAILISEFLDENSTTFSIERSNIKIALKQKI